MSRNVVTKEILVFYVALFSIFGHAQTPQMPIEEIVNNASQQAKNYSEAFKDLLADEVKTFETFDKNGNSKVKRTVGSTFIVYGLQNADGQIVEFRSVTTVDGKQVGGTDDRARSFFERVAASGNSARERQQLIDESLRHDRDIRINGITLFQAVPLYPKVRTALEFTRLPDEMLGGRKVIVLGYQQIKQTPEIEINTKSTEGSGDAAMNFFLDLKIEPPGTERLRGTFWIDAETFQTRREVREITARPANFATPVVLSRTEFNYSDSSFGILTPSSIVYTDYDLDRKKLVSFADLRVTFTYSKFSKADVEVRSVEIKN